VQAAAEAAAEAAAQTAAEAVPQWLPERLAAERLPLLRDASPTAAANASRLEWATAEEVRQRAWRLRASPVLEIRAADLFGDRRINDHQDDAGGDAKLGSYARSARRRGRGKAAGAATGAVAGAAAARGRMAAAIAADGAASRIQCGLPSSVIPESALAADEVRRLTELRTA